MKYNLINEAIKNVEKVDSDDIIEAIANYVGTKKEEVERIIFPIIQLWKLDKPVFCIWRHLATSQFENWVLEEVAKRNNGAVCWFTYASDSFSKDNGDKMLLLKIQLKPPYRNVRKPFHLCVSDEDPGKINEALKRLEGIPMKDLTTFTGKSLLSFHLKLREYAGFSNKNIIDLGDIFKKLFDLIPRNDYSRQNGMPQKEWYYPIYMLLASKLIVLEDFEVCKADMKNIVEKSYEQVVILDFNPNFVHLKTKKPLDWYMTTPDGVPKEIEKIIEEIIMAR